jgi:enoyl-CoA hydratase
VGADGRSIVGEPAAATNAVNTSPKLGANALLAAALSEVPDSPVSALSGCPVLCVALEQPRSLSACERRALRRWLERQAAPVIGIGAEGIRHPLACACDAVASDARDAEELVRNIEAAPRAAMVLVQVLRATEELDVERALCCESLAYATLQAGGEYQRWLRGAARPAPLQETQPPVLLGRRGAQLSVRLNRPARRNAISVAMRDALIEALELVLADPSIAQVKFSGAGNCFSAGGDLAEFGTTTDAALAHAVRSVQSVALLLSRCSARLSFQVHGAAIGAGIEMAAFGARVEASAGAFFQLPEIRYGLIPGSGGCVSLPRRIGRLRTAYLALSARPLDAQRALEWGLIDALCESALATAE